MAAPRKTRKTVTAPESTTKEATMPNANVPTVVTGEEALATINGAVRVSTYTTDGVKLVAKGGSIIAEVYAAVEAAGAAATGQDIVDAVSALNDGAGFIRPNGKRMTDGAVASTLRWLVSKGRLAVQAS